MMYRNRKGSALLIVLGFLAFMVVSAVAFSIYMRSERQPSSALRRTVATRYLVKAALARAISRVDDAIRADPYPGIKNENTSHRRDNHNWSSGKALGYYDRWLGRVFMPPEPYNDETDKLPTASDDATDRLVPHDRLDETVSVLNLEALGYLPTPLVNDVRYLSRLSWAAKWEHFNYDCGRYAFCAVDVSDFFDINRVEGSVLRTSANPITTTHLFSTDGEYYQGAAQQAASFENNLVSAHQGLTAVPFVSMLDYVLGMGQANQSYAPFYQYIGSSGSAFYPNASGEQNERKLLNQCFVTDSWMNPTSVVNQADLTNLKSGQDYGQPFPSSVRINGDESAMDQIYQKASQTGNSRFAERMANRLSRLDWLTLYDYLDRDDVPVSLALPCTERVPMIVGIQPELRNFTLKLAAPVTTKNPASLGANLTLANQDVTTQYNIDSITGGGTPELRVVTVFPFKRNSELAQAFKISGIMKIFFAPDGMTARTAIATTLRPRQADWDAGDDTALNAGTGCLVMKGSTSYTPDEVEDENDAVKEHRLQMSPFTDAGTMFFATVQKDQVSTDNLGNETVRNAGANGYAHEFGAWRPYESVTAATLKPTGQQSGACSDATVYKPYVAIWVRISNQAGDTVDLVPASMTDDEDLNDRTSAGQITQYDPGPNGLLRMGSAIGTDGFDYNQQANASASPSPTTTWLATKLISGATAATWEPSAFFAVDPRYNWAPEDWTGLKNAASGYVTANSWRNWVSPNGGTTILGSDGRNSDFFMFVSNQGYLQSIGELAFLPRLSDLNSASCALEDSGSYNGRVPVMNSGSALQSGNYDGNVLPLNWNLFYKDYRAYDMDGADSDRLFNKDIYDGTRSFYINPYTASEGIFMGALANTPYDWWVAGTNVESNAQNAKDPAQKRNQVGTPQSPKALTSSLLKEWTFNPDNNSKGAEMKAKVLQAIGKYLMNQFRANPAKSWEIVYDGLDWGGTGNDNEDPLCGGSYNNTDSIAFRDSLHEVDRKFLYAFWRNCFANRQQLFLIFVRAESTTTSGTGGQLGGRAVALVWRDPATPAGSDDSIKNTAGNAYNRKPHRTRILFYHQFE